MSNETNETNEHTEQQELNAEALKNQLLNSYLEARGHKKKFTVPDVIRKEDLSEATIDVLETFGLDAPSVLNSYSCEMEDIAMYAFDAIKTIGRAFAEVVSEQKEIRKALSKDW